MAPNRPARHVDIGLLAQIDLHPVPAIGVHHEQLDNRIVRACHGIALVEHGCAGRANCGAGDNANRAFIGALDDQRRVSCHSTNSRSGGSSLLARQIPLRPNGSYRLPLGVMGAASSPDFANPKLAVAHETDIARFRRERGVELALFGVGQAVRHCSAHRQAREASPDRSPSSGTSTPEASLAH